MEGSHYIICIILCALYFNANAQSIDIEKINFDDTLKFNRTIKYKSSKRIDFVEYNEIKGILVKKEYYNAINFLERDEIWKDTLVREIEYQYVEQNQLIKRYDVTNQIELTPVLNVQFYYPALAREYEIEGVVEVKLDYTSDCIPVSYTILNSLGNGIDEEVIKKMDLILRLSKKYKVPFHTCKKPDEHFKIHFRLH